jgi:lipopolysaccharide transport system ATP-binding protein
MRPAIRVDNLSKEYRIGTRKRVSDQQLREIITEGAKSMWNRLRGNGRERERAEEGSFWALKDVSFEVQPGEVVGIIGRNGAGKSTLLKVLSRIVEPTSGRAEVHGRMASLLEVGTGFHPELTGRENIYLNGSILGMSRWEIAKQFDEIVAFAGIEKFLETPVKRYSSGLYVRLGFAVAAHLSTEILLVDEVLAVGDAQFQQRCLGKLQAAATDGRTVFLVSHQMAAIRRLCSKTILMERGRLNDFGETARAIEQYLENEKTDTIADEWVDLSPASRSGTGELRFVAARLMPTQSNGLSKPEPDQPVNFRLQIYSNVDREVFSLAVTVYDLYDTKLVNADTVALGRSLVFKSGITEVDVQIAQLHLTGGRYKVGLWLANNPVVYDHVREAFVIEVTETNCGSLGRRPSCDGLVTCMFESQVVNRF